MIQIHIGSVLHLKFLITRTVCSFWGISAISAISNKEYKKKVSPKITDVCEECHGVRKFMTKVDKTETKYECKINALTTQSTHIHNLFSVHKPTL
jgi:hypothetical protein